MYITYKGIDRLRKEIREKEDEKEKEKEKAKRSGVK